MEAWKVSGWQGSPGKDHSLPPKPMRCESPIVTCDFVINTAPRKHYL